ncbi:tRNA N6-adenosine threonylcarbamoyltransferase [endosymbiont of Sipalinus gigas]|uniref:tRNA (adenosine(37)-N6)-threonylcarbamoyltransferase complex transferase subunit TsaD n=1 Tax=endosymbiont of Sipalinus gigas TaxID=1972134 RepID=UPI000DC6E004|nr:tRNA (adenosine(37)-N6)-threonylcarbamoyltransferase complex transferase subunit TsaD [endosymbiont of Sipalinus gigas]BBA85345.1 tRNA N6-adenosine threonylcarbamoyltransferase [endosymbiont of Sipalinus gigas]
MKILGIETSCDETGIAIYDSTVKKILNKVYSQKIHSKYGGVVPELASRNHLKKILPLIKSLLNEKNISKYDINCIAYTAGPGLFGSLVIGACISKSLSYSLNIPLIPINHLEGHLLSPIIDKIINFPFIGLIISGGHTQIIKVNNIGNYNILGESIDDSVGEAFDKVARLLGIEYPGGRKLSMLAKYGVNNKYKFPRPLIKNKKYNFSFSGLKTFVSNIIKNIKNIDYQEKCNIAKEFENSVIDILLSKSISALKNNNINNLVISGGVSANTEIRKNFNNLGKKNNIKIWFPKLYLSKDNGAMIAYVGYLKYIKYFKKNKNLIKNNLYINSRWDLELSELLYKKIK